MIGMLWYDPDPKADLATKLERAIAYYLQKYGQRPNTCALHPCMLPADVSMETLEKRNRIHLAGDQTVLPNHLLIGVNGDSGNND